MTASSIELAVSDSDQRIARYAAAAIALSLAETAIPTPLPGVKPGLANIVVLLVLLRHGWREAAWVAALRLVAGSLISGQLFAPAFFLAASGTLASLATLALVARLPRRFFGPVSWSILAAFAHIAGQLVLARWWLVPHDGLFYLVPLFAAAALCFGLANGLIAVAVDKELA